MTAAVVITILAGTVWLSIWAVRKSYERQRNQ